MPDIDTYYSSALSQVSSYTSYSEKVGFSLGDMKSEVIS